MTQVSGGNLRITLGCSWFLRYSIGYMDALTELGHEVTVVTHSNFEGADVSEELADLAARAPQVRGLVMRGRPRSVTSNIDMLRFGLDSRLHSDLVHLQESPDWRSPIATGAWPGRFALTVHDPTPHLGDEFGSRYAKVTAEVRKRASLIFTHGEELAEQLRRQGGLGGPVVSIPHGTASRGFVPIPEGPPRILFFGRIIKYKGLDVLLEALPEVWRELPTLELVIAGEGELPSSEVLRDPRVTTLNRYIAEAEVPGLFEQCSAVVLPYVEATQSGVLALAKEYGRAAIASDVGSIREAIVEGAGLLVPPGDRKALAKAVISRLGDSEAAELMGRAASQSASGASSWKAVAEVTLSACRAHRLIR